jgi:hypothetical protein
VALTQIKKSGESGRGLALAGTIIGYVTVALWVLGSIAVEQLALGGRRPLW